MKNTAKTSKTQTVKERPARQARAGQEKSQEISAANLPPEAMTPRYTMQLLPRVIRSKDAPRYLGMDKNRFNREVRPGLVEFPIGKQGIGFDRLDLDAWFDAYKERNGRPGPHQRGDEPWDAKKSPASSKEATVGISTSKSQEREWLLMDSGQFAWRIWKS